MNTELEAMTKICPVLSAPNKVATCCFGNVCAMWRWDLEVHQAFCAAQNRNAIREEDALARPLHAETWEFWPHDPEEDNCAGWVEPKSKAQARRFGYCGLGGKP